MPLIITYAGLGDANCPGWTSASEFINHLEEDEPSLADLSESWYIPVGLIRMYIDNLGRPMSLGEGGCGTVFLGKIRSSQDAAIKVNSRCNQINCCLS